MSNQNKQKTPKYTIEFKQDAANLVNEKGYTHKHAADTLGISLSSMEASRNKLNKIAASMR